MEKKDEYKYNRVVIVGNGLDLAMGLKTSYTDFLLDYFIQYIRSRSGLNCEEWVLIKNY